MPRPTISPIPTRRPQMRPRVGIPSAPPVAFARERQEALNRRPPAANPLSPKNLERSHEAFRKKLYNNRHDFPA
jgi:hypothetical protein